MHNYIEFFDKLPFWLIVSLMVFFGLIQGIGEILEFKGKAVPEAMKIRKYFKRKRREKESFRKLPDFIEKYEKKYTETTDTLVDVKALLTDVQRHYSEDNIAMRDGWMREVNEHIVDSERLRKEQADVMKELKDKLDQNNEDTLELKIESKRSTIIDFASYVIDESRPVTREQFNRIFKTYNEYEETIEKNGLTNGEVDIAYRIITEAYETHMRNRTFIEDIRGYDKSN